MFQRVVGFRVGMKSMTDRRQADGLTAVDERPYAGLCTLCANCSRRFQCLFPSPAANFWSCDQHRAL